MRILLCVEAVTKELPGLLRNQFPRTHAAHALLMAAFVDLHQYFGDHLKVP